MKYSILKIASILGIKNQNIAEGEISLLLTDSRKLSSPQETLFFAIETKQNDAHKFISDLYGSGVRNFVVTKLFPEWKSFTDVNFLKVTNTLHALQKLAAYHRKQFSIPVIGITGSNGKSTTTALAGYLLQKAGFSAEVAGNIGKSLADFAFVQRDFLVVELSSFQLHWNTRFACDLAMVTNLAPDHIDWHGSYAEYIRAKAKILSTQSPGGFAIVQETERSVLFGDREDDAHEVLAFSWDGMQSSHGRKLLADEKARHVLFRDETGAEELLFSFDDVPLIGKHNMENAAFAAGAIRMLTGKGIMRGPLFSGFKGLAHRCEFVANIRGVTYVDDSKGTNVAASATALRSLTGPKIVILGGQGKGEEYAPLAEAVKSEAVAAVVLGAEKERIVKALKEAAFPHIHEVSSMEEAVQTASTLAFPQSTVLLSPACTSWDMYPNYKKRGEHFQQLVLALEDEK